MQAVYIKICCTSPTRLNNVSLYCDVKLQHCFNMVIREDTFIQASLVTVHGTLNCDSAVNQLNAVRQGAIIPSEKHKKIYKEDMSILII